MASSILAITGNDLPFASLGGKYPRLELNQLGLCHARHTIEGAASIAGVAPFACLWNFHVIIQIHLM